LDQSLELLYLQFSKESAQTGSLVSRNGRFDIEFYPKQPFIIPAEFLPSRMTADKPLTEMGKGKDYNIIQL